MGGRFRTIIIPYIIWCTLYFLYYVVVTHISAINNIMSDSSTVELTLSNWVRHIVIEEYYTLWFLKNLIIFIFLTPIFYVLLKNYSQVVPTGLVILIGISVLLYFIKANVIEFDFRIPLGIEIYMAGSYFGINHKEWICKSNKKVSVVSFVVVCCFFLTDFKWFSLPLQILFFIACWYALDLVCIKKTYWWMGITFFTYVAHDIPLEAFEKIYFMAFGHSSFSSIVDYIFMPLIVEGLLITVAYMLIKFTPRVWKFICGGRVPKLSSITE